VAQQGVGLDPRLERRIVGAKAIAPVPEPGRRLPAKYSRQSCREAVWLPRRCASVSPLTRSTKRPSPGLSSIEIGLSRRVTLEPAGLPSCSLAKLRWVYSRPGGGLHAVAPGQAVRVLGDQRAADPFDVLKRRRESGPRLPVTR
jgi:hypothetical protein